MRTHAEAMNRRPLPMKDYRVRLSLADGSARVVLMLAYSSCGAVLAALELFGTSVCACSARRLRP